MNVSRGCFAALGSLAFALVSCTSLQRNYSVPLPGSSGVTPTPSPGSSSSSTPSACATQNPAAVTVAMVSFITPTAVPTFGTINGYAVSSGGTVPAVAQEIDVTPGSVVQFLNGEESSTPPIEHSAVGFGSAAQFPATPFAFPAAAVNAEGSNIGTAAWSTGRIAPGCYSASFTVPNAGTYLFGDYDYYDLSNTRDVIVASAAGT